MFARDAFHDSMLCDETLSDIARELVETSRRHVIIDWTLRESMRAYLPLHGVGLLKRDFLHYSRSPREIALMRQVKAVFDPKGVMNPGKLLAP